MFPTLEILKLGLGKSFDFIKERLPGKVFQIREGSIGFNIENVPGQDIFYLPGMDK